MTDQELISKIRQHQLRPTKQRLHLGQLLFGNKDRHVTAEGLYLEAKASGISVSLATVYNTLNQFAKAGLLKEVQVDKQHSYFDTNTRSHFHVFRPSTGEIWDAPSDAVSAVVDLTKLSIEGSIEEIDIVVRIS